jgi:hypothetical protein
VWLCQQDMPHFYSHKTNTSSLMSLHIEFRITEDHRSSIQSSFSIKASKNETGSILQLASYWCSSIMLQCLKRCQQKLLIRLDTSNKQLEYLETTNIARDQIKVKTYIVMATSIPELL